MHTFHIKEKKIDGKKNGGSETRLKWLDMIFSLEVELMKLNYELDMKGWDLPVWLSGKEPTHLPM